MKLILETSTTRLWVLQLWGAFGAFKHLGEEKQLWVKIPKQGRA
jgi:hypothetical protein